MSSGSIENCRREFHQSPPDRFGRRGRAISEKHRGLVCGGHEEKERDLHLSGDLCEVPIRQSPNSSRCGRCRRHVRQCAESKKRIWSCFSLLAPGEGSSPYQSLGVLGADRREGASNRRNVLYVVGRVILAECINGCVQLLES